MDVQRYTDVAARMFGAIEDAGDRDV